MDHRGTDMIKSTTSARLLSGSRALTVVIAAALLASVAPARAGALRAPDGSAIQGFSADPAHTGVVDGRLGNRPRVLWQTDVGVQGYYNNPLVVGNLLVVSSYGDIWNTPDARDGVYVLRRTDGVVVHHLRTAADANGVSCDGQRIYAVTDDGGVQAWELATGRTLWAANPFARAGTPVERMSPAQAFAEGYDEGYRVGYAEALASMGYLSDDPSVESRLYGAPLILADGLLVAGAGGVVALLDPSSGQILRRMDGSGRVRNHSAGEGFVAFGNTSQEVQVFDSAGRELYRWCAEGEAACGGSSPYPGAWMYAAPAIHKGRIAVAGSYYTAQQFALIDAASGRTLWSFGSPSEASTYFGGAKASPALTDNLVLFADTTGHLVAHAVASGQRRWSVDDHGGSWSSPMVVGDKVVWATESGKILILALGTGKEVARVDLSDRFFATPAIADGVIYVGGDSGQLYAIDSGFRR
jgi:outer membrane protein assembly factor BamB